MKVYLDAGHGGKDSGAVGLGGRLEKDDCQRLTELVVQKLQGSGISVILNNDVTESVYDIVCQSNSENVDLFISIHRNAFMDPNANGLEVWTCTNAREVTKRNANLVYNKLINVSTMKPRGVKESNFYVLTKTNAPAMLLEIGFVTNFNDNILFDQYIDVYAEAIVSGIKEILGVYKYTVIAGEYTNQVSAELMLNILKVKGIEGAYIR